MNPGSTGFTVFAVFQKTPDHPARRQFKRIRRTGAILANHQRFFAGRCFPESVPGRPCHGFSGLRQFRSLVKTAVAAQFRPTIPAKSEKQQAGE